MMTLSQRHRELLVELFDQDIDDRKRQQLLAGNVGKRQDGRLVNE